MKEIAVYDIEYDDVFFLAQKDEDFAMRIITEEDIKFTPFYGIFFSNKYVILGEL